MILECKMTLSKYQEFKMLIIKFPQKTLMFQTLLNYRSMTIIKIPTTKSMSITVSRL